MKNNEGMKDSKREVLYVQGLEHNLCWNETCNELRAGGVRWSVFTVTTLVALVTLYYYVRSLFIDWALIVDFGPSIPDILEYVQIHFMWDSFGLVLIFILSFCWLILCEMRTISYYRYAFLIEEIWLEKNKITSEHKNIFSSNSLLHKFMKHEKLAKIVVLVITLSIVFVMFIYPILD